jgi:photosystem II stability/assembly factor-like uncharacterized protein
MKKLRFTTVMLCLLFAGSAFSQVTTLDQAFTPTGVSNDGLIVGYYDQTSPYYIWTPLNNDVKEIGGVSAGNGVGGKANFSADSKYICSSMWTNWIFPKSWQKNTLTDYAYKFNAIEKLPGMNNLSFVVGESEDGSNGIIMLSSDGQTLRTKATANFSLKAVAALTTDVAIACGKGGNMVYTTSRGNGWTKMDARPEGCTDTISCYESIDFTNQEPYYGVVGARLKDNKFTAYQSSDGGETWNKTTGVEGVPLCITHTDNAFYMGTENGKILKSTDNGVTWTKMFATGGFLQPTTSIFDIKFVDSKVGLALTNIFIYRTEDGGTSWSVISVDDNISQKAKFYNALWQNDTTVTIVGSLGVAYTSTDKGLTWKKEAIETDNTSDLNCLAMGQNTILVGGVSGNFYYKNVQENVSASEMGRYDVAKDEWTPLGSLGFLSSDENQSASSGYAISGDGKTVVGLASYAIPTQSSVGRFAHATAWNEDNGIMDLGSLWDNVGRSTRANAVNFDGSVVVGWQDHYGSWYAAVWYRNDDGTYRPNEYILKDANGSANDEGNYALEAWAVTADGKYIGGRGESVDNAPLAPIHSAPYKAGDDTNNANQPWIWSKDSGLKYIGMIDEFKNNDEAIGYVTAINNDASLATGFFVAGSMNYGFIWTKDGGMMSVNTYLTKVLKMDESEDHYCSVMSLSPNGRYAAGWGISSEGKIFAYQIDLLYNTTGINNSNQAKPIATVYPNPVADVLHVDVPFEGTSNIRLYNMQGKMMFNTTSNSKENEISVGNIPMGLYLLEVNAKGLHYTYKVQIKH